MTDTALEKPDAFRAWAKANHETLLDTYEDFVTDTPRTQVCFFDFTMHMWTEVDQLKWLS